MIGDGEHERDPIESDGEPSDPYGMPATAGISVGGYFPNTIRIPAQRRPGVSGAHVAPGRIDEPQVLWTWAADDLAGRGVRGVTDSPIRARRALLAALQTMPAGGEGTIRQAWLDLFAFPHPCYRYGPVSLSVHRNRTTGKIIFDRYEG